MKNKIKPSILPGFMELTPQEQMIFDDMVNKMIEVYKQNGCMSIDTPIIEKEEILLAKSAGETEKQVYRIANEKNKQALRFDLTVPFARYVVQHMNDLTFPFKRYQLGKVYRGERNQKGRYREFYQLDLDIVSPTKLSINYDAYVISVVAKAFDAIGLKGYKFQLSNRKLWSGLFEVLELSASQEVMTWIDKYDKVGKESCMERIEALVGEVKKNWIEKLIALNGPVDQVIQQLEQFARVLENDYVGSEASNTNGWEQLNEGIRELQQVVKMLQFMGVKEENLELNFKIIRGLDYYTGTVFETVLQGYENYGSVCSGGRYDDLAKLYTEQTIPGVGISIGVTRLFFVLKEIGFLSQYDQKSALNYLIVPLGNTVEACIKVNHSLQNQGFKSEIYFNEDSLKK